MNYSDIWKPIKIKDLGINVYKGKSYDTSDLINSDNIDSINYITRTEKNNGIKSKVSSVGIEFIEEANAITIGDTTATIFYQKDRFVVGEHVVILRADWFNEAVGNFIVIQLRKEKFRYPAFARAFIKELIENTEILIPIDNNGKIDIKEIESFINSFGIKKENILSEVPDYFLNEGYNKACWYLENINKEEFERKYSKSKSSSVVPLNTTEWKNFRLGDEKYFEIRRGSSDYIKNMCKGEFPYISTTKTNNGVSTYVAETNRNGNLITLAYDGSIGACFYQEKSFFASEKIVTIDIKQHKLNVYIAMFLIQILKLEAELYSYGGRKWTVEQQLKNTIIKLPSTEFGEPDWDYMEKFIKGLPFSGNLLS